MNSVENVEQVVRKFWESTLNKSLTEQLEGGKHVMPLSRIKRVMKSDEDVKMISSEAPILFSKAIELFIQELMLRSWLETEEGKRKTLQKADIVTAVVLIDILPQDEIQRPTGDSHWE